MSKEFGVGEKIRNMIIIGRERREQTVVEMEDWEAKQLIIREKKKLGEKKVFIDHDLTKEGREIQRQSGERKERRKEGEDRIQKDEHKKRKICTV